MSKRILSLIASSTEIACALGFGDDLVGRSHECDFPERVRALPSVTAPRFAIEGSSAEVDARVKASLAASPEDALSVYEVDVEGLRALAPDIILTQSQCEVCAVSLADVERAVCELLPSRPTIVALEPNGLEDIWSDIRKVAAALDAPERGEGLIAKLRGRMAAVEVEARRQLPRPRVALIEWTDPLMAAGNWMPELVALAGGENLFGEAGKHSPWMSWEELAAADPDIIVSLPCGYGLKKTRIETEALAKKPAWNELAAVKSGRVYLADGNQYFNRPGPRIVESLEILTEMFFPEVFEPRHRGSGWEPL